MGVGVKVGVEVAVCVGVAVGGMVGVRVGVGVVVEAGSGVSVDEALLLAGRRVLVGVQRRHAACATTGSAARFAPSAAIPAKHRKITETKENALLILMVVSFGV